MPDADFTHVSEANQNVLNMYLLDMIGFQDILVLHLEFIKEIWQK